MLCFLHRLENHVPRIGSGGPATTEDQAEMERLVCALSPRVVGRTRAEVSMASKKRRDLYG